MFSKDVIHVITFPENLLTTSGLILLHDGISFTDAMS